MNTIVNIKSSQVSSIESKVAELISQMGLDEKIGQMSQLQGGGGSLPDYLAGSSAHLAGSFGFTTVAHASLRRLAHLELISGRRPCATTSLHCEFTLGPYACHLRLSGR